MKKALVITVAALLGAYAIFMILRLNTLSLALFFTGMRGDSEVLFFSHDSAGQESRILRARSEEHDMLLVTVAKNWLGFWSVSDVVETPYLHEESSVVYPRILAATWQGQGGFYRFDHQDTGFYMRETHTVYMGDTAIQKIEFLPGQIPPGVAVDIRQTGKKYALHVVTYSGDTPPLLNLDIPALLVENGCIEWPPEYPLP